MLECSICAQPVHLVMHPNPTETKLSLWLQVMCVQIRCTSLRAEDVAVESSTLHYQIAFSHGINHAHPADLV